MEIYQATIEDLGDYQIYSICIVCFINKHQIEGAKTYIKEHLESKDSVHICC